MTECQLVAMVTVAAYVVKQVTRSGLGGGFTVSGALSPKVVLVIRLGKCNIST